MKILLDTNVIIRNFKRDDPQHGNASSALENLVARNVVLCVAPQVMFEFWVVATRETDRNGLGLAPAAARRAVDNILANCVLLPDSPVIFEHWLELCTRHSVRGKRAHDARLVAWMLSHQIAELLTFNVEDFNQFTDIAVRTPQPS